MKAPTPLCTNRSWMGGFLPLSACKAVIFSGCRASSVHVGRTLNAPSDWFLRKRQWSAFYEWKRSLRYRRTRATERNICTYCQKTAKSNPLCLTPIPGYISSILPPPSLKSPLLPCLRLCSWFALYLLNNWWLFWFPIRHLGSAALSSMGLAAFLAAHHTAQSILSLPLLPTFNLIFFFFALYFIPRATFFPDARHSHSPPRVCMRALYCSQQLQFHVLFQISSWYPSSSPDCRRPCYHK